MSDIVLTGGTESMSQSPFVARNIRYGITLGTEPKVHIVYVYVIKEHESQSIVIYYIPYFYVSEYV